MLTCPECTMFKHMDTAIDKLRNEVGFKMSACAAPFYPKIKCTTQDNHTVKSNRAEIQVAEDEGNILEEVEKSKR